MAENPTSRIAREILINGQPLSKEVNVKSISVLRYFNKIATAKLKVQDGDPATRAFVQSSSELFKPGNEIEIQLGYDENPSTVFKGIIIRHAIHIRGGSLLEIEAKDKAVKMAQVRNSASYTSQTDKQTIDSLARKHTLTPEVEDTGNAHQQMVQYYCSDWDFVLLRAEANSMFVHTHDGTLVVKKPSMTGVAILTATYGDNIVEFDGEMDARRHYTGIHANTWDFDQQQARPFEPVYGAFTFTEAGNLSSVDLALVLGNTIEWRHGGDVPEDQLRNRSNATAMRNQLSKASGRVRIRGNQHVLPGSKITLAGVGDRFNGDVYVTGVLHQFDGEFTTDIQFGWADEWFYHHEDIAEKPASGLVPGVCGLQVGVVRQLAGAPAGKVNHVLINLPVLHANGEGIWARVASLDAGNGRGFVFRPDIGDEVIIGFINDDPRDAVILGMMHSQAKSPPTDFPVDDENPKKGVVTRAGMKIEFDDQAKLLTIAVPGGSGTNTVMIDGQAGKLELKDQNQNLIKMDASGITIESQRNIKIKGTKIDLN